MIWSRYHNCANRPCCWYTAYIRQGRKKWIKIGKFYTGCKKFEALNENQDKGKPSLKVDPLDPKTKYAIQDLRLYKRLVASYANKFGKF